MRDSLIEAGLQALLTSRERVNAVLDDDHQRRQALQRLDAYAAFTREYFGELLQGQDPAYFTVRRVLIRDQEVGVAGLNSAWRSTGAGDSERGLLVVGDRQRQQAAQAIQDTNVRVALVHHPFEWLHPHEAQEAEGFSLREFDLVLSGHLHQPSVHEKRSPQGSAAFLPAGSLFQGRDLEGYSVIQLGPRERVLLRRYVDGRQRFDADTQSADGGAFDLRLARRTLTRASGVPAADIHQLLRSLRPGHELIEAVRGDLDGDGADEIAVLSRAADGSSDNIAINLLVYRTGSSTWELLPAGDLPGPVEHTSTVLFLADLTDDRRQQVVAGITIYGSAGHLTYRILGYADGVVSLLLERSGVPQGSVEARPNGLIEHSNDRATLFSWNGRGFFGSPLLTQVPVPAGSATCHYYVTETRVGGTERIDLRVGQRLQLIRDDHSQYSTRILAPGDILEFESGLVLRAIKSGVGTINIIPRGYDWDNALEVQVVVTN